MNENLTLEQAVARHIANEGVAPPADAFYDELIRNADQRGQRPRWLALIKEHPMRYRSSTAVGSPTVRLAAILIATMLLAVALAGAGIAGTRLLAAGPIVVDADGGGDYTTIVEAVAAAGDGDTIQVMPGTYEGQVQITSNITLQGVGDRDKVILKFEGGDIATFERTPGLTERAFAPYGLFLHQTDAVVRNLTVSGPQVADAIVVIGGAPSIEGVTVHLEQPWTGWRHGLLLDVDTAATIDDVDINAWLGVGKGTPTIRNSRLSCGSDIAAAGANAILRDNVFRDDREGEDCGYGIAISDGASPQLIGNDLSMASGGIIIEGEDTNPLIERNRVHSSGGPQEHPELERDAYTYRGITVEDGAAPRIVGNELADNETGIYIGAASPVIEDNAVSGGSVGIEVTDGATPTLVGNTVCGNTVNLEVTEGGDPTVDGSNTICE